MSSATQPVGTTGELPGTATPLTLIGLIGLLSATAAAAARTVRGR
jgi:hypothetical protein